MPSAKKYKLFSIADGKKPICAFFSSPAGCRNGDECRFLHEKEGQSNAGGCGVAVSDSASVISSESEEGEDQRNSTSRPRCTPKSGVGIDYKQEPIEKKRKADSIENHDDPFASPKQKRPGVQTVSGSGSQKKKPRQQPSSQHEGQIEPRSSNKKQPHSQSHTKKPKQITTEDYRSFASHLPVASLSTVSINNVAKEIEVSSPTHSRKPEKNSYSVEVRDKFPLPKSTEIGRKWKAAVLKSREHERYNSCFNFASYKQKYKEGGILSDWIKARSFGAWCSSNPQAIAIDCEMCETQDPLSGSKNPKALCRISVVNAEYPDEVLLDTLVKPDWPVSDYRSRINGIDKEHLENVQFTLRHAQAFMMALCSDETVIVGHAVHNDLVALNMEHNCIADSSFLFHAKDSRKATVSLKDLVSSLFQEKMPETHDSVNDARKALGCVAHWVKNSGNVVEIQRSTNDAKSSRLFVHRIPKYCKAQNLCLMFQKHTDIVPQEVDEIEFSGTTGKTHVAFKTSRHARLAFETLDGVSEPDKSGRLQKKVYLKNGDYIRIRKMIHEKEIGTIPKLVASP
ncbi:unnamed protein product [Cylindrotheca closterium]|uniref:C3H1-type domain-containing protein n=1 Tax=Cylindrotheca closterium TaxID=2856 RepID=A0AAD2PXY3_9STRA|nr:unnamed protein product [Cylindrotheca closterium]